MVAQTDDFLSDLEAFQQPQTQEFPDFLSDLEPPAPKKTVPILDTNPQNRLQPQQTEAQQEAPDFLADLQAPQQTQSEAPKAEKTGLWFIPKREQATEKKQSRLMKSFKEGISQSASGELAKQVFEQDPGAQEKLIEDPSFWESLVRESGTISGDIPYLAAGATLGAFAGSAGGPIGVVLGGGFGATALPAFLKESLRQYRDFQENSKEDLTFGEFLQRADKVANRTLSEGIFGAILGMTKKAIPLLEATPGIGKLFSTKLGKTAGTVTAEAAVATAVSAAAEGRLPEAKDFAHALALFAGFNLAHLPANVREHIQKQGEASGLPPEQFAKEFSSSNLEKIKRVAEQGIPKEVAETQPKAESKSAPVELPEGVRLEKPEHISPGIRAGKHVATVAVRQENGSFRAEEIPITKEEQHVIAGADRWEKLGDHAESSRMNQEAREMIFNRLKRKVAGEKQEGAVPQKLQQIHPKEPEITESVPIQNVAKITQPKAKEQGQFTTAKGSVYKLNSDGTTTRTKAARAEHPGEEGLQPTSEKTWYVSPEQANLLSEVQTSGPKKRIVEMPDGRIGVQYAEGPQSGKFEQRTVLKPNASPKEGLIPVESFEKGDRIHFGNKIVSMGALEAKPAGGVPTRGKTLAESVSFETKEPKLKTEPKTEGAFRTAVIDELYPLQRYVSEAGIENLPITEDPYRMARLFKGWSGKAETFLDYKTFDPDTLAWKGKGFKEIIKPYKNDLEGLSKYLVAKRAVELSKQGKETGIDLADAQEYVKANENKYSKPAKEIKKYQNDVLDYAQKSGLISEDTKHLWQDLNENYVPFQRVIEEPESEFFGKSMQPKKQFYELKGSKRPIIDPLESIIGNTYTVIRASEQNNVLRSLAEFDKKYKGASEFIEVKEEGSAEPTLKNFYDYLKGEDVVRDDSIRFFDDGKLKTYKVPKEIAEVLKGGLKQPQLDFLGRIINYPTRLVRTGAITLSPGTLAKLATIDQMEAFLYTDIGYVPYFDLARGLFNAIKKPEMYHQWKAAGGDQSLAREMSRSIKQQKLKQVADKHDKSIFTSMDGLLRAVENVTRPLEEATRLSVFEKTLKRKGMSPEALRESALAAREATLDFAKKGAKTRFATQAIPFFNAAIQGADKFWQELKKNPKLLTAKAVISVTLPTLLLYYANKDRKEYQELPDWEKDGYWHFYSGHGTDTLHLKLPKPFELGAVFATVPEHLAAYADKKDPEALNKIIPALIDTFTPSFTPAIAAPFLESYMNKKIFSGAPVIPERLKKLPSEEQTTPYTTETAKRIGQVLAHVPFIGDTKIASPIEIEHWLDAWSGGLGSNLLKVTDKALEKTGIYPEKVDVEKELSDYPVLKNFFGKKGYTTQAASIRKFYDEYDQLEKMYNSLKLAAKEGRQKDIPDKEVLVSRFKQAQKIRKAFGKNFAVMRNIIQDNENYTSAEKKILIDQLTKDMVGVAREFQGKEV